MKIKSCLYFLGLSCFPISIMALINIFYSFYFNYLENLSSYLVTMLLSIFFGLFFLFIGKKEKDLINFYEQLLLIFLVYFSLSFLLLIPYYFSGYYITFIDSYFESISGLTGTGFSIFENTNYLDQPLILWRSSTQWIGGFYFLIFLVLIFSNKQFNYKLIDLSFNLEKKINFSPNLSNAAYKILFIYSSLSVLIFFIFLLSGLRILDSINLTMTVISSGGFLPTNTLDEIIINDFQSAILSLCFVIPIFNFYLLYNVIFKRDNLREHYEDIYLFILILIFVIVFYFINDLNLSYVFVNILSSISTSGITIGSVPNNFGLYFIILTLIGGSVLSNTSGIKLLRIYILVRAFLIEISKLVKPNVMMSSKIMFSDKKIISENIKISFLIFILFFLSQFVLSSILLLDTLDFESSFKLSILTLTNTAVSNIYGLDNIQFTDLFTFSKISIVIFMVIAKVELLSIFILFQKIFIKN